MLILTKKYDFGHDFKRMVMGKRQFTSHLDLQKVSLSGAQILGAISNITSLAFFRARFFIWNEKETDCEPSRFQIRRFNVP